MSHVPTFFEGPEKKVEVVVREGLGPLRQLSEAAWREMVAAAGAEVLSVLRSDHCDAYLLSESSLFVYDRHFTMITCGRTTLCDAVLQFIKRMGAEQIALLIYERKNENFPNRQRTSFYDDVRRLNARIPGRTLRFGDEHDHHVQVFYSSAPFEADAEDRTLEILMHGLPDEVAANFVGGVKPASGSIAQTFGLGDLLEGFEVDEHPFTPAGYSMNALRDDDYCTVHVTPESIGSFVSFETNVDFRGRLPALVKRVSEVFQPRSLDVIAFAPVGTLKAVIQPDGYVIKDHVRGELNGYDVSFWHGYKPLEGPRAPVEVLL